MKIFRKFPSLLVISLFTIAMMTSMTLQNDAFAGHGEQGFSVTATAPEGSGQIDISGYSGSESGNAVTILVVAPNGNIVHIDQLSPNDHGEFSTVVGVGSLWGQDGTYSIKIESGGASLYSANLDVDVANGVTAETNVSVDNVGVYGDDSEMTHGEDAYAPQSSSGLTISADAVEGATNIGISGSTDRTSSTVIVTVIAPNGNIVTIDQLTPSTSIDSSIQPVNSPHTNLVTEGSSERLNTKRQASLSSPIVMVNNNVMQTTASPIVIASSGSEFNVKDIQYARLSS